MFIILPFFLYQMIVYAIYLQGGNVKPLASTMGMNGMAHNDDRLNYVAAIELAKCK